MDSQLRKYLEAGHTLADAAAYAGLGYEEARQQLTIATDDADLDSQRLALASHAHAALETLNGLLGSEDDRIRLTAAKTLLELQVKHKPKGRKVEVSLVDDLWTTAAARSVHRDGGESGVLQEMDGSGSQESLLDPLSAADDSSLSSMTDHVREDAELGRFDVASDPLDFHPEDLTIGPQDAEDVGPPADRTPLPDSSVGPSAPCHTLDGKSDSPYVSIFDCP